MKRLITYLTLTLFSFCSFAQVEVGGIVIDGVVNEPLAGVSVILKGADNKIKKFGSTNKDGKFSMSVPSVRESKSLNMPASALSSYEVRAAFTVSSPSTHYSGTGLYSAFRA